MSVKTNPTEHAVAQDTQAKLAEFVECSGHAIAEGEKLAQRVKESQDKVAAAIPGVVDQLVAVGAVLPEQKQVVASRLADHEQAVSLLGNMATLLETSQQQQKQAFDVAEATTGDGSPDGTSLSSSPVKQAGPISKIATTARTLGEAERQLAERLGIPC